jgi:hypothetical protein
MLKIYREETYGCVETGNALKSEMNVTAPRRPAGELK